MRTSLAVLTLISSFSFAAQPAGKKPSNQKQSQSEKYESYQLIPKDESAKDKSLVTFLNQLKKVVEAKDAKALSGMLNSQIKYSFGSGEETPKGFFKHFELDKNPAGSRLWPELRSVLNGGGVFREMPVMNPDGEIISSINAFVMPYTYAAWPDDKPEFEFYEFSAINSKDVPVYKAPNTKSEVLEKISYLIVRSQGVGASAKDMRMIVLPSGKKGHVESKYLSSPIGYRASFIKRGNDWKMDFFIAGD